MKENIDDLEFVLTRSMAYKLEGLNDLIKRRNELIILGKSNSCESFEISKELRVIEKKIAKIKKKFISEFRYENKDAIDKYWEIRSRE